MRVTFFFCGSRTVLGKHPCTAFGFVKEGRTFVLGAIYENAAWHAQSGVVMQWTRARRKDDALDGALCTIHKSEFHVQVVRNNHACLVCQLQIFSQSAETFVVKLVPFSVRDALMVRGDANDWLFVLASE